MESDAIKDMHCDTDIFLIELSPSGGSPGYGSDYEEEARYTPNGPGTSVQSPYHTPENELLKQQLIDHHRDSPRPPFSQPQMIQGMMQVLLPGFLKL